MIASQIGFIPNIGKQRGSCADYNANNTWYFSSNLGCVNINYRYTTYFRSRPVLDYDQYDNELLESYPVPLSHMLFISKKAEKGKKGKPSYVYFALHRIEELVRLTHEINNCEIMPREGTTHIIFEPRIRQIVCASTGDRDIQTFYVSEMQPYLERFLYHTDSYSCRPGKGALRAVMQLQEYIFEATEGYTSDAWIAKRDIKVFFMSIDCFHVYKTVIDFIDTHMSKHRHKELLKYLTRVIYLKATKDHLRNMSKPYERMLLDPAKNIYNQPYYKGVPIGDWTSQMSGLIETTATLNQMSALGYRFVHYTDDNVAVVTDKSRWVEDEKRIARYYADAGLKIHPEKKYMQHHSKGVELLGYKLRFNRILPSDRTYHNIMWYLTRMVEKANESKHFTVANKEKIRDSVNSYLGLLGHINAFKIRREICRIIESSPMAKIFTVAPDYSKVIIRPQYTMAAYYRHKFKELKQHLKPYYYEIRKDCVRCTPGAAKLPVLD